MQEALEALAQESVAVALIAVEAPRGTGLPTAVARLDLASTGPVSAPYDDKGFPEFGRSATTPALPQAAVADFRQAMLAHVANLERRASACRRCFQEQV